VVTKAGTGLELTHRPLIWTHFVLNLDFHMDKSILNVQ
jgi:hypothetical protein